MIQLTEFKKNVVSKFVCVNYKNTSKRDKITKNIAQNSWLKYNDFCKELMCIK